jgi:hypothetical protein
MSDIIELVIEIFIEFLSEIAEKIFKKRKNGDEKTTNN